MNFYKFSKSSCMFLVIMSYVLLIVGCDATSLEGQYNELVTSTATTNIAESTKQTLSSNTMEIQSATATPTPSSTYTSKPTSTNAVFDCKNEGILPSRATPDAVDTKSGRVAVDDTYLYFSVHQYIGMFDISVPESPEFLGFWELPYLSNIADIQVKDGIIYVVSDSTLYMLNLSPLCQFEIIFQKEMPIQIFQIELDNDRLYVGGASENNQREVIILAADELPYQEIGTVLLGDSPATWSIFENTLYGLSGNLLTYTSVSKPASLQTQTVNLTLDSESLLYSPGLFMKDTLYLLFQERGGYKITIVNNLKEDIPLVKQDPTGYVLFDVFQIQDNYVFVGTNSCDVSCASGVAIADIDNGQRLSGLGFEPQYHPINIFHEIRDDLIYVFSNDTLLVVDLSKIREPEIITQISFIS